MLDITVDDLTPFADIAEAKAEAMIADALAMAELVAPCINDDDFPYPEAAKAIIRGAILRWNDTGSGATIQQVAGAFQETITPQPRRGLFSGPEKSDLERLCLQAKGRAFEVDLTPEGAGIPLYPWEWNGCA